MIRQSEWSRSIFGKVKVFGISSKLVVRRDERNQPQKLETDPAANVATKFRFFSKKTNEQIIYIFFKANLFLF